MFAQQLHDQLGSLQSSINTALDNASQVPFLNKQLGEISNAQVFTTTLLTDLQNMFAHVVDAAEVQQDLFDLLGPGGTGPQPPLLAAHDGSGNTPTVSDVGFSGDDNGFEVDMRLHQGLVNSATPFNLGLGLPGVPFKVMSSGTVAIQVGFDYELAFKYIPSNSNSPFSVDTSKTLQGSGPGQGHEMSLNVTASLPSTPQPFAATVIIGFLEGQVADHMGDTSMNLSFNLDGLDPSSDLSNLTPSISGNANIDLDLTGGFQDNNNMVSTAFPSIKTEFDLKWGFDTANPNDSTNLPEIDFNNVQLELGSYLRNLLYPILTDIQEVTQPLQPVINALKAPIPGLSDLSNDVGLGNVSLESLAKDIGPATQYNRLIQVVTTLVDIANDINSIQFGNDDIFVPLGSFKIGGANSVNGDLRSLAAAGDPTQGLGNLTKLLPEGVSGVLGNIKDELSNFSGDAVNEARTALTQLTDPKGISFSFPLFQDPVHSAFLLFLGQDADFIRFTANYQFNDVDTQSYGYAGLVITFGGSINLDLNLAMAYDTYGIRKFLNDPNKNPADFLDGLYIDNSPDPNNNNLSRTHIAINGNLSVGLGVGIPDLVSLTVNGGVVTKTTQGGSLVDGPLLLTLEDPDNDGQGQDNKLRASEIAYDIAHFPQCIFNTSGEIDSSLFIDFKVGVDVPVVGFIGYEKQFPLTEGTLINFDSNAECSTMTAPPPPVLAGFPDGNNPHLLHLYTGIDSGLRQNVNDMSMGNETFEVSHIGTDASGNEIVGVTAFGYTQIIGGVQGIFADGSTDASDTITVDQGVVSDATLLGSPGNDRLTYLGTGHAHLFGRAGNDELVAGAQSQTSDLHGGGGNDVLKGGGGADTLSGDGGSGDLDTLIAGPGSNQTLDGGAGSNQFYAGTSTSTMNGGAGKNVYTWQAGNGAIKINGLGNQNLLEVDDNSGATDTINVSNVNGDVIVLFNGAQVIDAADIQQLNIETKTSPDAVTINDLSATSVKLVLLNYIGEASSADNVTQTYTLYGPTGPKNVMINETTASGTVTHKINDLPTAVNVTATLTQVTGLGPVFVVANPEDKLVVNTGDGNTTVNVATTTQGGALEVDGGVGTDVFNVQSISGPTTINTKGGQNTINVGSEAPSTGGTLGGIKAGVIVNGSGGLDTAYVDDTGDLSARTDGVLTPTTLTGLGMGSAGITYSGLAALNIFLGSVGGNSFTINDINPATVTAVDGGTNPVNSVVATFAQDFNGKLLLTDFQKSTITVGHDFNGVMSDTQPGSVQLLTIVHAMTRKAILTAGSIDTATIGPNSLVMGDDMAGQMILGRLGDLRVAGGTPGTIIAKTIGTVRTYGGYGSLVLQINEAGIQRRVEAAVPGADYPIPPPPPAPVPATTPAGMTIQYVYEGLSSAIAPANPQLTARISNSTPTHDEFDLSLVVWNDLAKFNLARLDATGISGVRNVAVEGDLLTSVSPAAASFFPTDNTPAGIQLPQDALAGVGIRNNVTSSFVRAASLMGVAFGSVTESGGVVAAKVAGHADAETIPTTTTAIVQANDTFRVPFSTMQTVAWFFSTNSNGKTFDNKDVLLSDQGLPDARGAVTALSTVSKAVIQSIALRGDYGSIVTQQAIALSVSSTGPMGDLILSAPGGIVANVTATGFWTTGPTGGSISATNGAIASTILTTGMRTDPISGVTAPAVNYLGGLGGDLGRAITTNGAITGVTFVSAGGGGLASTGKILAKGNLVSQVNVQSGLDGVVATDGDIGVIQTDGNGHFVPNSDGSLKRFGGLVVSTGGLNGQVIALGNVFGDISITGGLGQKAEGRIAVLGNPGEFGLAPSRYGILGNVIIKGDIGQQGSMSLQSGAIVSAGLIGDVSFTHLSDSGTDFGILAAGGNISFASGGSNPNPADTFMNVATPGSPQYAAAANINAIDWIFTSNGGLDVINPNQLGLIITDLLHLTVSSGGLTGTKP
jgi:hypothetical protein